MKLERAVNRITELIVRSCDPDRVLLFGSYAKGQARPDSDLDIRVIGDFRESPYLRGQEVRQALRRSPTRIDGHFLTPGEVAAAVSAPHSFPGSVFATGVTLYRRLCRPPD